MGWFFFSCKMLRSLASKTASVTQPTDLENNVTVPLQKQGHLQQNVLIAPGESCANNPSWRNSPLHWGSTGNPCKIMGSVSQGSDWPRVVVQLALTDVSSKGYASCPPSSASWPALHIQQIPWHAFFELDALGTWECVLFIPAILASAGRSPRYCKTIWMERATITKPNLNYIQRNRNSKNVAIWSRFAQLPLLPRWMKRMFSPLSSKMPSRANFSMSWA